MIHTLNEGPVSKETGPSYGARTPVRPRSRFVEHRRSPPAPRPAPPRVNPSISVRSNRRPRARIQIQSEDEYRKPGLSKERRLEPQITLGLFVDTYGFPLELRSFEGNRVETMTIVPVLKSFSERHGLKDITVVADAAMF